MPPQDERPCAAVGPPSKLERVDLEARSAFDVMRCFGASGKGSARWFND